MIRHAESPNLSGASATPVRRPVLGLVAILITVVLWGLSGVAIKAVSTTGMVTVFYRHLFAVPLLWLSLLLPGVRCELNAVWLRASVLGGLMFSVHQILYFTSLKLTTVANVTIIGALQPALVLLLAGPMFGEHATRQSVLWALIAFTGTALVVLGASHAQGWSALGDGLAVVNLFAFTAYFLASKRFREHVGAWEYVVGMSTVSAIVVIAATLVTVPQIPVPALWELAVIAALAILAGSLGHVLSNWAHAHVSAFAQSMLLLAVPVIATVGAVVFLGETFGALQAAGAVVVLVAITRIVTSVSARAGEALAESAAATDAP